MMCSLRHGCNLRECPANVPPVDLLIGEVMVGMCLGTVDVGSQQAVPPVQLHIPMPLAAVAWRGLAAPHETLCHSVCCVSAPASPPDAESRPLALSSTTTSIIVAHGRAHSILVLEPCCVV